MGEESAAQCTSTDEVSPAGPSDRLRDTHVGPVYAAKHNPERPLLPPPTNPAITASLVNILFALALGAAAMAWTGVATAQAVTVSADVVRSIQMQLTVLGYEPGPADGLVGSNTIKAVRAFQADQSLPETGELTEELLAQLDAAARMSAGSQPAAGGAGDSSPPRSRARPAMAASSADGDGDGLSNELELQIGTDPENADTDGDGVPDGVEIAQGRDPLSPDSPPESSQIAKAVDSDGDGLPDHLELTLGTDPNKADTDGDGIPDREDQKTYGQIQSEEQVSGETPEKPSDLNAKIERWIEMAERIAALRASLKAARDGQEGAVPEPGSSQPESYPSQESYPGQEPYPQMIDSDGDGYPDEDELAAGSNPYDPTSVPDYSAPPPAAQPATTGEPSDAARFDDLAGKIVTRDARVWTKLTTMDSQLKEAEKELDSSASSAMRDEWREILEQLERIRRELKK